MSWTYGKGNWKGGYYGYSDGYSTQYPQVAPVKSQSVSISCPSETIPASVEVDVTHLYVDVVSMSADMELGEIQAPEGMSDGCMITIRKNDTSKFKIKLTDSAAVEYHYIDKKGETITLLYSEEKGLLVT